MIDVLSPLSSASIASAYKIVVKFSYEFKSRYIDASSGSIFATFYQIYSFFSDTMRAQLVIAIETVPHFNRIG